MVGDDPEVKFVAQNALQTMVDENKELIPVAMVTGFTVCLEGLSEEGEEMIIVIPGPHDFISKGMGHVVWMDEFFRKAAYNSES